VVLPRQARPTDRVVKGPATFQLHPPCWVCHECGHAEDFDGPREWKDCPKCRVNCEAGVMFLVQRRYRPLTPGTTQGGSKKPTDRPRPDVEVPSQVAKPEGKAPLFTAEHCMKIAEVFAKMFAIHDRYMAEGGSRLDEDSARHRRSGMTSVEKRMAVMLASNTAGTFDSVKFHKACEGSTE